MAPGKSTGNCKFMGVACIGTQASTPAPPNCTSAWGGFGRGLGIPSQQVERSVIFRAIGAAPKRKAARWAAFLFGADDGSRTHLIGLGSRSSTDELHPRVWGVYHRREKSASKIFRQASRRCAQRGCYAVSAGGGPRADRCARVLRRPAMPAGFLTKAPRRTIIFSDC